MAFLEWRKFAFFDVHKNIDNKRISECLQDTIVTVATSGNAHVVLGDVTGWAHLISRSWEITSFKAYELTMFLAQQLPHDPYLVTVGEDEPGVNPLIRVWDWSRNDRHGNPTCTRVCRAVPSHLRNTPATALAVHDNKNLLAVGFQDGSVTLFRGDIARQRSSKMKTLTDSGTSPITGLAFKDADKLFIVSRACVMIYYMNSDRSVSLDSMGAAPGCSVLADKRTLTLANTSAIYCYTTEGRGPCYALKGEKVRLNWFRSYLVITTNEPQPKQPTTSSSNSKSHHLTILDIQNKFIVFSKSFDEIDAVLTEWGSFYILTKNKEMIYLEEKDLQSKLSSLFKKNLYDVAIRIASSQHYDKDGLMEIYKQYGDHLFNKGDLKCAVEQYIKTIGWLETSYVIRKYLSSRHVEPLVMYLEAVHERGASELEHTSLLLACCVKLQQGEAKSKLHESIAVRAAADSRHRHLALQVVRQISVEDALTLASNHKRHDWYLKMIIEDKKKYKEALDYIAELEFEDAELYMKTYGHVLVMHEPEESVKLLKLLCTDYKPRSKPLVDENSLSGDYRRPDRALCDDYVHILLNHSAALVEFLEHMISSDVECSQLIYNALIEHYIHVWKKSSEPEKSEYESKILKVLKCPNAKYDKDQTLIVCKMAGFKAGMMFLYEENKLWRGLVGYQLRSLGAEAALARLRSAPATPDDWLQVLWAPPPAHCLPDLLSVISNERLLSPILVIDCLASTPSFTLGDVRKYLVDVLKTESDVIMREDQLASKYKSEIETMKAQIHTLQHEPVTFQGSKCAVCNKQLELPSVHFLCQHSFHKYCFESYSESERECLACEPRVSRSSAPPPPDLIHSRLHTDPDPYAVLSEFFGRGLFNKLTVVSEPSPSPPPPIVVPPAQTPAPATTPAPPQTTYGPGAEAKLRLQEGQSKQVYIPTSTKTTAPKTTAIIPVPEGRMRVLEQHRYSSSLEANMNKIQPPVHTPKTTPSISRMNDVTAPKRDVIESEKISAAVSNPFEEEYDDSKNPFAEDDGDSTNPFSEGDDYDTNLNPFS